MKERVSECSTNRSTMAYSEQLEVTIDPLAVVCYKLLCTTLQAKMATSSLLQEQLVLLLQAYQHTKHYEISELDSIDDDIFM